MADLAGKKVAILVDNYFEQAEFTGPKDALEEAGATVEVVAVDADLTDVQGLNHIDKADTFHVDEALESVDIGAYDALILPGGAINADSLRMSPKAREWVKEVCETNKPLGAICHAPWLLASSGVIKGKKLTSYFTIQDDLRAAGGNWVDEEVVIDGNIITSRQPDDVPAFNQAVIAMLSES